MNDRNWRKELEPIIRKAGDILLSFFGKKLERKMKPDHGFATEADLTSEKYLIEALGELLPEASFCAEESGKFGSESSEYCWVIDPLDGTTNFVHGLPYFCVSVALVYRGQPIVAVTYQPTTDEFYFAQKGEGAWLNDKKISVSHPKSLSHALIGCSLPYRSKVDALEVVQQIVGHVYGVRHYGAAALDLAYVSVGRFDGVLFMDLAWWDVAAGILLITEAGGKITDFEGKPIGPDYASCVAGSSLVHQELLSLLRDIKKK